ncbi:hypothetical protein J4050_07900 [Winogradskyella sp. DF17]|uniref:DUF1097 domain-containing protein n=1 Tax=Winogradskyella pelagia TaxID=2819984 RepID=A0ABS3T304_9FLAO|nr:hypothetical protein [Winogradskyella sp. DF17]MBO3116664.1 hypothetical protein [Winogradskyella sp. DF17]
MNRNLINFLTTLLLAISFSFFLPWWSVMVAAILTAIVVPLKKSAVFFVPFFTIAIFWIGYSFLLGKDNDFILAKKVANLLSLGGNHYLLLLVTGVIGGLAAGIAGVFGKQLKSFSNTTEQ